MHHVVKEFMAEIYENNPFFEDTYDWIHEP